MFVVLYATPMPEKKGGTQVCDSDFPSHDKFVERYAFNPSGEEVSPARHAEIELDKAHETIYKAERDKFLAWLKVETEAAYALLQYRLDRINQLHRTAFKQPDVREIIGTDAESDTQALRSLKEGFRKEFYND